MVIQSAVLSAKGATNVFKLGLSVSCVHAVLHMLALVNKGITQEDKGGKDIIQEDKGALDITQDGLGVAAKVVPAFQVLIVTPWSKESPS